jgi:L-alanine-DL-glutamate epimerase-like enolase superfamily enzyme
MRVTSLETWLCKRDESLFDASRTGRSPLTWDVVVMRLGTDAGLNGHACALAARSGNVTESYMNDRTAIWHEFWNIDRHLTFFPVYLPGPVDVALYDLAAQAAGLPLYQFLGACRTSLPTYASSLFLPTVDAYVEEARRYVGRGFGAYKAHPPGPWRTDIKVHHALRDALGPDVVLMTDPVSEYTLEQAIHVGRELERAGYHWFEEPFRDFELAKYAKLCAALDIPIAGTETTRGGPWGVAQAIQTHALYAPT